MKPIKFLAMFGQPELFPERSTVGQEISALLLATFGIQPTLRPAHVHVQNSAQQQRLPIEPVRRSWRRR